MNQKFINKSVSSRTTSSGFTLIEGVMVVGIAALLGAMAAVSFLSFRSSSELTVWANNIIETANRARQKTLQSEGSIGYGLHLQPDRFVLFPGGSYDPATSSNAVYMLPNMLEIASISLQTATPDIMFERIVGTAENYGTFAVRQKNDPTSAIVIAVHHSGTAGTFAEELASASVRITDSRHVHFTFNQNIDASTALLLEFPDYPADNVSIDFQDYLNVARTEFFWEGTVTAGGNAQRLKVHTHSITPTSAEFSVHRDRRHNDAALIISLSNPTPQQLIQYDADGIESKGSSVSVSEPVRQ